MNKFEAENKKEYLIQNDLVTAKEKIAYCVNSDWFYSMYWKDDTWVEQAKADCITRLDYVEKEFADLQIAMRILNEIEE
jgi:hypothetical protein